MKRILIFVIVIVVILGGIIFAKREAIIEALKGDTITITQVEEKQVNPLDAQIKIREKELEERYRQIKSLEASIDVKDAEVERLQAEIKEERKKLAGFLTAITLEK